LEEDLAATRKRWKIAFLHRSPYGSPRHGGDERVREDQEPVFARHKVDVVFAGYDHVYEPTVPIRGVTYVVSRGGGRRLYRVGKGKHTAASAPKHHAVLARVDGGCLSLEAVEPGGTVLDRSDLEKQKPRRCAVGWSGPTFAASCSASGSRARSLGPTPGQCSRHPLHQ
jgi:acid phosphatase type 7